MRHLKTSVIMVASLVLSVFMGVAGCGDDHRDHFRGDRDRSAERYERPDNDRRDNDRPAERGGDSSRDRDERGGR